MIRSGDTNHRDLTVRVGVRGSSPLSSTQLHSEFPVVRGLYHSQRSLVMWLDPDLTPGLAITGGQEAVSNVTGSRHSVYPSRPRPFKYRGSRTCKQDRVRQPPISDIRATIDAVRATGASYRLGRLCQIVCPNRVRRLAPGLPPRGSTGLSINVTRTGGFAVGDNGDHAVSAEGDNTHEEDGVQRA